MKSIVIACLPVGRELEESEKRRLDELLGSLPDRFSVEMLPSASSEVDVLDRIEAGLRGKPALLLLAAMHGASARMLTLASVKSSVPVAIWCHDRRHSLASSAIAAEANRQLGISSVLIHDGSAARARLITAASAAAAKQTLSQARIGQVGLIHPNLVSASIAPLTMLSRFGAWIVPFPISALLASAEAIVAERLSLEIARLRSSCAVDVDEAVLRRAASVHLALSDLCSEHRLNAVAVDCWQEMMPNFGTSPCMGFSTDDYRIACEGDATLALTLLAGEALCGTAGYAGDLCSYDDDGTAVLMHCAGAARLQTSTEPVSIVGQPPPAPSGQSGRVVACRPVLPTGPGTLCLLHGRDLELMHLRKCDILGTEFPEQMQVRVRVHGSPQEFIEQVACNHYVVFPGDNEAAWRLWAQMSGITIH